ncbi:MAG: hypothetical protein L3K23_02395 [Thermoplasmata archaeon]|nr:hypothetical protein [Thermoplasmata archaeon]
MLRRRALRSRRGVLGTPESRRELHEPADLTGAEVLLPAPTCFWLTSESLECFDRVAPELQRELAGAMAELSGVPGGAASSGHDHCSGCPVRQGEVAALAVTAGALVRSGTSVLVTYRLAGAAERGVARGVVGSIVEISLDGSEVPAAPAQVPVIYRAVANGALVERTLLETDPEPAGRPEVLVDGRRGPPAMVAAGIVDVLARAGWLQRPSESGEPVTSAARTR